MKFYENLKYLRKESNFTQEELAEKLSVSRQAVTKWESGQSLPDIENLKQLSDIFGVTMDSLVGDIETKKDSIMNKKINDIGYFIFALLFLLVDIFLSIFNFFKKITSNETIIAIATILIIIMSFVVFVLSIQLYLRNTKGKIVNMKNTEDGRKERLKIIFEKAKIWFFGSMLYNLVSNIDCLPSGLKDYFINIIWFLIIDIIIIALLIFFSYKSLENKVKELNKDE